MLTPRLACLIVLFACALPACTEDAPPVDITAPEGRCEALRIEGAREGANLVVIVNDTMRRDYAGVYGGAAQTPHLDAFAEEHLTFDQAVAQAPWTKPSIASLFTSQYPSQHRVLDVPPERPDGAAQGLALEEADVLADSLDTLAETLAAHGFRTGAFVSNPWLLGDFGFDQGFEVYDDSFAGWGADGTRVVEAGTAWLDSLGDEDRYLLYLHFIDSHRPYGRLPLEGLAERRARLNRGERIASADGRRIALSVRLEDGRPAQDAGFAPTAELVREAYGRGVERFDVILGELLAKLQARDDWARTAVIVTSDHGEALFTRGWGNHGGALFEDVMAIPFVARWPGVSPATGRVDCLVGLIDVMPSACDYLDVPCPEASQGWSLFAPDPGEDGEVARYLAGEGVMGAPANRFVQNRRLKLVYEPQVPGSGQDATWQPYSLFDLSDDPREERNRLDLEHVDAEAERQFGELRARLPDAVVELPGPDRERIPVQPEVRRRLEALGYGS